MIVALLLASVAGVAACGAAVPAPQPVTAAQVESAQRRWPESTEAQLAKGRDLFNAKCNACHDYPILENIEEQRWTKILQVMGPRASLDRMQVESVMRFVVSVHPVAAGTAGTAEPAK